VGHFLGRREANRGWWQTEENLWLGYTLEVGLILKLVAGLLAGLREYFVIVAAMVIAPCVVLLFVLLVRLLRPSRAR
jgi:hypothetical protein